MTTRTVLFETLIVLVGVACWVGLIAIFGHVSTSTWRNAIVTNLAVLGARHWSKQPKQPWRVCQIFALHSVALPAGPLSGILFWNRLGG